MKISVSIDLRALAGIRKSLLSKVTTAATQALNDTAFKVRTDMQQEMREVFDRPTPYIVSSVTVDKATPNNLVATVTPKYKGGKGVEPVKILRAEVYGGPRRLKRSEVLLQRAGILPNGYFTVPGEGAKPLFDQYGNLKGSFIVQLLSYLQAFPEVGYRANMTDKRKKTLAKRRKTQSGYVTINGVQYFVAYGKLRGDEKDGHLAPGIWSRTGIHGFQVKPILMFVRQPTYRKRLDLDRFASPAQLRARFTKNLAYRLAKAPK